MAAVSRLKADLPWRSNDWCRIITEKGRYIEVMREKRIERHKAMNCQETTQYIQHPCTDTPGNSCQIGKALLHPVAHKVMKINVI